MTKLADKLAAAKRGTEAIGGSMTVDAWFGRLCQVFPRLSLRPFDCPYLFACIFGIPNSTILAPNNFLVSTFAGTHTR